MGDAPKRTIGRKKPVKANDVGQLDIQVPDPLEDVTKAFKADNAHLLDEIQNAKKDFIAIFGLFAAILIFLSLEVKIFDQPIRMAQITGISFFFLSALLVFALGNRSAGDFIAGHNPLRHPRHHYWIDWRDVYWSVTGEFTSGKKKGGGMK